jgi:Leucine-rich repeat (LRR) protein
MLASFAKDVRGADLSYSLISSWDVVALIVVELPSLERLSLKYVLAHMRLTHTVHRLGVSNNRLQPLSNLKQGRDAFSHLTELQLNGTLMTWQAIMGAVCLMPRLQRLEAGYNRLQYLSSLPQNHPELAIATLNLDSNQLSDWVETCQALASFHKYCTRVNLNLVHFVDPSRVPGLTASSFHPTHTNLYPFQLGITFP